MSENPRDNDRASTLTTVRWRCDKCGATHAFAIPGDADAQWLAEARRMSNADKHRARKFLEETIAYSLANYGEGSCVTRCEHVMAQEIVRLRNDASRADPALAVDPSRSCPNASAGSTYTARASQRGAP